ncbi:hypothetical protein H6F75_00665 [Nodosilinea sp. FACHB-131]|uniref:hypothetical protein n=1 Tax=Cyanophyceae TaxID=3028117 RepID=UPI0016859636|nr:hypothetical protein [Nodosilinea sp. FACHB-131]MBD1871983.1 hypothetical protein [Nodosilinea sp. FACHB-131]
MSHPSYRHFIGVLHGMLSAKAAWLADESQQLSAALRDYGAIIHVEDHSLRDLEVAAYLKNMGALYLSGDVLAQRTDRPTELGAIKVWQLLSARIARHSGMDQVALILDGYYQRSIPEDQLTSLFQVVNCWVSCRTQKGYRLPMSLVDARMTLEQRANMCWSEPALVEHFLSHYPDAQ